MNGHEPVGSVAEEAAKLFAALQGDDPAADQHGTTRSPAECQWCPVCQLVGRIRQCSPESIEHLTTAAVGVLASLRSLLDAATEAAMAARQATDVPPEEKKQERVDVSEDPEPWD